MRRTLAVLVLVLVLPSCAAVVGPITSAAGGWWTHDRIDKLEENRVEALEERVRALEVGWGP